jgi:hypothetical protein
MVSSTLREANPVFGAGTRPEQTPPRKSCILQDLRGGRSNGPFARDNGVFRLRQHRTFSVFFRKIRLGEPDFSEKDSPIPPCRRRIGPVVQADAWVWNRPRNSNILQNIP